MNNSIMAYEWAIRFAFFFGILVLMAIWEVLAPRRPLKTSKSVRWYSNLGLVFIDTLAVRLLLPTQAVGMALRVRIGGLRGQIIGGSIRSTRAGWVFPPLMKTPWASCSSGRTSR